jgi:hypothetical protein
MSWLRSIGAVWRYLIGVALAQALTGLLVHFSFGTENGPGWSLLGPGAALVAATCALWFSALAASERRDHAARLGALHAREREELRVAAERRRTRELQDAERRVARAAQRGARPLKLGLVAGGVAGVGGALMLTPLFAVGVATVALAGGAALGWRLRSRPAAPMIDVTPAEARPSLAARWRQRMLPERGGPRPQQIDGG